MTLTHAPALDGTGGEPDPQRPETAAQEPALEPPTQVEILRSVIEGLSAGVVVADAAGSYRIFNRAAQEILGLGPLEVHPTDWGRAYGYSLFDSFVPYPADQLSLGRGLRGEEVRDREIFIRNQHVPQGRWIEATTGPWRDESGAIRGAVALFHDVGDRKASREVSSRPLTIVEQATDSTLACEVGGTMPDRREGRRRQADLDAGQAIQRRLYPKAAPKLGGFDIAGAAYPADFLCGDYYDFFPMPGGALGLTVGDVCGHGIGSSILMAQARAYLRLLAETHADIGEVFDRLNQILTVDGSELELVTQILVRLDPGTRTIAYTNAGHPPGILVDRSGAVRQELRAGQIPLGLFADVSFPSSPAIPLATGDVLLLFTDGLTECQGADGSELGRPRVVELLQLHRHRSAAEILAALADEVASFREGAQVDDMTFIVVKTEAACEATP